MSAPEEVGDIQSFNMMFGTDDESIEQIQRDYAQFRANMWKTKDEELSTAELSACMAVFQTRIALCLALHSVK